MASIKAADYSTQFLLAQHEGAGAIPPLRGNNLQDHQTRPRTSLVPFGPTLRAGYRGTNDSTAA